MLSDTHEGDEMVGETGTIEEKLDRALRAISLAGERHVELAEMVATMGRRVTEISRRVAEAYGEKLDEGPGSRARERAEEREAAVQMAAAAREAEARESDSTLCNGEVEACRHPECRDPGEFKHSARGVRYMLCDIHHEETLYAPMALDWEREIVGERPLSEVIDSLQSAGPRARETVRSFVEAAPFIQSEREHPAPPSPAFDPHAAAETCSHSGCRRRAFASLSNIEGDHWLACAEHYEQDLASQARADGHEPAWRVPIGPGVVLERWRGGPIGVKVDGELRCYVTAGELARIFEGPVD